MIKVPKFFHELLGFEQSKTALLTIISFVIFTGILIGVMTQPIWSSISALRQLVVLIFYVDIAGGVIANLTQGTNAFYNTRPKARLVFISIHVQPIILAWALTGSLMLSIALTSYTVIMSFFLNHIREHKEHRLFCGVAMALGCVFAILEVNTLLSILYVFYVIKVLYNFSVNHERSPL